MKAEELVLHGDPRSLYVALAAEEVDDPPRPPRLRGGEPAAVSGRPFFYLAALLSIMGWIVDMLRA